MKTSFLCACGNTCREKPGRKTRLCRACVCHLAAARRSQLLAADPEYRVAVGKNIASARLERLRIDPAFREQQRRAGEALGRLGLGVNQYGKGHPVRQRIGAKGSATKLGFIAPGYRDIYRPLRRRYGVETAHSATRSQFELELAEFRRGAVQPIEVLMRVRDALRFGWGASA